MVYMGESWLVMVDNGLIVLTMTLVLASMAANGFMVEYGLVNSR